MSIIRSYGNAFEIVDQTENLLIIPNTWGLINDLGIFNSEGVSQHTITLEKITQSLADIKDMPRGTRSQVNKDYAREIRAFAVPHFNLDDAIMPQDIQGKRAYGSNDVEVLDQVRMRKLERIRKSYAMLLETARAKLITAGTAYAPNSTVSIDFYSEFGITRDETDFVFGTSTTDIRGKIETVIANIQDKGLAGDAGGGIIALCSPVFFNKLINHATVTTAYQYYTSTQEPLRMRLEAAGLGPKFRDFYHAGIRFIEYRGTGVDGTALIPSGDAYAFPTDLSEVFETYYSPAGKMDLVNTIGQEVYAFEYVDPKGTMIEMESESNFLNVLRRPAVVQRLHSST